MEFFQRFRQHCAAQQLAQPGDRLLLAVSGGLDSRVLLDLFLQLQLELQLELAIGHVNHQLRGAESDADEAFVRALAEASGAPFFSQRVDVPAYAREHKLSLETAARELRYQALEHFRESWQARAIVTAHTLDDQAETILDHLMRGCGLAGLSGMAALAEVHAGNFLPTHEQSVAMPKDAEGSPNTLPLKGLLQKKLLRPLLPFSRAELETYAHSQNLQWREDRSNIDPQFRRNRIRHELLPLIKTRFNPQILRSLERLARIAADAETYVQAEVATLLPRLIKERKSGKIILDLELFWKYFPIIRQKAIRAILRMIDAASGEPTFSDIDRILALIQNTAPAKGKRFIWRNRVEVFVDHAGLVLQRRQEKAEPTCASVTIGQPCKIPGTTSTLFVEQKDLPPDWRQQINAASQFVDAEKVRGPLIVRFMQPGDRFIPIRTNAAGDEVAGSKKLSDFFIDLRVPRHRRQNVPILEGGNIIWVCGYRLDNRYKVTPATRTVLHLQILHFEETTDALTYQVSL